MIRKFGAVVKSPSGFPLCSPYVPIANRAFEKMRRMLVEFGCTPASRTSVTRATAPTPPSNPLSRFLR